jgi:hypothetical protein
MCWVSGRTLRRKNCPGKRFTTLDLTLSQKVREGSVLTVRGEIRER